MATSRPRRETQMALIWELPASQRMRIPEAVAADLVDALATLLLEAAGIVIRPPTAGGADESTDASTDESQDHR